MIIVDSSNTSLRDNETRQMFRLIPKNWRETEIQLETNLKQNPTGGYTWPSPTQWPTHSMCPASRFPQSQFIQNGILQYDWDIFVPHKAIKFGKENSNSALQDVVSPEIYRQRFSKFYRVKPTCKALKENAFDFKKLDVRIRTFDMT